MSDGREPRRAVYERIGRAVIELIERGDDVLLDESTREIVRHAPNSFSRVALVDALLGARVNQKKEG